jgi:hypothetical protein
MFYYLLVSQHQRSKHIGLHMSGNECKCSIMISYMQSLSIFMDTLSNMVAEVNEFFKWEEYILYLHLFFIPAILSAS